MLISNKNVELESRGFFIVKNGEIELSHNIA